MKRIKLNRRGFLGLMGGAAAAGPSVAQNVATNAATNMSLGGLELGKIGLHNDAEATMRDEADEERQKARIGYAKKALKLLLKDSKGRHEYDLRRTSVYSLEENVASLRSVSLTAKMRMSKPRILRRKKDRQRDHLEGIIKGYDDDDYFF